MSPNSPSLLSGPRLTTLFASILVSLASGTNYVFSAYGPQLAKRLSISHTKLNLIGISGNVGVYASAPLWGKLVDARGPKPGFLAAFALLLLGYLGTKLIYDAAAPAFAALVLCAAATGAGGNAGNSSGVNAVATSFPDRARATATGLVLAGFGLSAFVFGAGARGLFPGDTSRFLTLLALGTALPQLLGLVFVKRVPVEEEEEEGEGAEYVRVPGTRVGPGEEVLFDAEVPSPLDSPRFRNSNTSRTPLLVAEEGRAADARTRPQAPSVHPQAAPDLILHSDSDSDDDDPSLRAHHAVQPSLTPVAAYIPGAADAVEMSTSPSRSPVRGTSPPYSPTRDPLERRLSHDVELNASRGSLERRPRLSLSRSLSRSARVLHEAEHAHIDRAPRARADSEEEEGDTSEDEENALLAPEVIMPHVHHNHHAHHGHGHAHAHGHAHGHGHSHAPNVYGRALFVSFDFWLLFVIVSTLSGTGLMYINNVGSMAQALYAGSLAEVGQGDSEALRSTASPALQPPAYDDAVASALQATQVSILSLMNCAGRVVTGLASDFVKTRMGRVRSVLLIAIASCFLISQIMAANIDDPASLWMATAALGFSYGSLFGVMPAVIIEWFGIVHFSENWGFVSLAPMFAGNLFSLAFGRNLDREGERGAREAAGGASGAPEVADSTARALARAAAALWGRAVDAPAPVSAPDCVAGRSCYSATLHLTAFCCFCALILSAYAAWRDERMRGRR
ncbi:major facilitator superfamily domain-containing protein [Schizophyllum fasciatum]